MKRYLITYIDWEQDICIQAVRAKSEQAVRDMYERNKDCKRILKIELDEAKERM